MKLLKYNAKYDKSNESFSQWKLVNEIMFANMPAEIKTVWLIAGYDGIAEMASKYFGMNRIYRDNEDSVTFEFTEQQWTMFALRWL